MLDSPPARAYTPLPASGPGAERLPRRTATPPAARAPRGVLALFLLGLLHACGAPHAPTGAPIDDAAPPTSQPEQPSQQPQTQPEQPSSTPEEQQQQREIEALLALGPEASASLGSPADGQLRGGVALPLRGPGFRFHPSKGPEGRHGTIELVRALLRAAAAVDRTHPGGLATIGELSLAEGGPISGHGSHQAGRDVDLLFYLLDADGAPFPSKAIPLDPAGQGADYGDLLDPSDDKPVQLDLARTWAFVEALLEAAGDDLQRIFVVEHIRGLLLAEAERAGAAPELRERFAAVTCQPGFPHDDHLHIRFFCAADDIAAGCTELDPIYPWQRQRLAALGLAPVKAAARRRGSRPKLTTHEEARAKAGPMHQDVIDFLDRRRAWVRQPHPGRPYCR